MRRTTSRSSAPSRRWARLPVLPPVLRTLPVSVSHSLGGVALCRTKGGQPQQHGGVVALGLVSNKLCAPCVLELQIGMEACSCRLYMEYAVDSAAAPGRRAQGLPKETVTWWFPMPENFSRIALLAIVICLIDVLESISIAKALAYKNHYELKCAARAAAHTRAWVLCWPEQGLPRLPHAPSPCTACWGCFGPIIEISSCIRWVRSAFLSAPCTPPGLTRGRDRQRPGLNLRATPTAAHARVRAPRSPTQELQGLGIANLMGAAFNCYTTTGSFSRSAVMDSVGACTQLAGIISGAPQGVPYPTLSAGGPARGCARSPFAGACHAWRAWREFEAIWKLRRCTGSRAQAPCSPDRLALACRAESSTRCISPVAETSTK